MKIYRGYPSWITCFFYENILIQVLCQARETIGLGLQRIFVGTTVKLCKDQSR